MINQPDNYHQKYMNKNAEKSQPVSISPSLRYFVNFHYVQRMLFSLECIEQSISLFVKLIKIYFRIIKDIIKTIVLLLIIYISQFILIVLISSYGLSYFFEPSLDTFLNIALLVIVSLFVISFLFIHFFTPRIENKNYDYKVWILSILRQFQNHLYDVSLILIAILAIIFVSSLLMWLVSVIVPGFVYNIRIISFTGIFGILLSSSIIIGFIYYKCKTIHRKKNI